MRMWIWTVLLALVVTAAEAMAQREIAGYDFSAKGAHQVRLGRMLREISGLTVNRRGQLLAHDDEKGVIYRIDEPSRQVHVLLIAHRSEVYE